MLKLHVGQKRPGSILATSISLVAVFLTLVVGSMVYVQNTMSQARTERLRTSAEEAARSGLELVLGWAEANIDQETRLPKAWDSMTDGQIIDPIGQVMENATAPSPTISTALNPGTIIGVNHNEYVVGRQGQYVTTFKARIQQFRLSDDMPRQYRIGVVGRVRKVQPPNRAIYNNIDNWERESLIAERVIVATVGKEVTSRYAALIDIDGVKNWVPGEVVTGPVHINRGYVDQAPFKNVAADIKTAGSSVPGVPYRDLRSTMMLYIEGEAGNVGFKAPSAPPADGVKKYPIFESQVSLTEIPGGSAEYKPMDPPDTVEPLAIKINGFNYHKTNSSALPLLNAYHDKIFVAGENSMANRYGFSGGFYRGPLVVRQPIELPRSVRNSLGSAVGLPGELAGRGRFNAALPNGVYVPTPRFWDTSDTPADSAPPADSYRPASTGAPQAPAGGIYIRGEVEAMRFGKGLGAQAHLSYYLFQVSKGIRSANTDRSVYMVIADRATKQLMLHKFSTPYKKIHGGLLTGGDTLSSLLTKAGLVGNSAAGWGGASINPLSFQLGNGAAQTFVFAPPQYSEFPFNGVIYVDCERDDNARPTNFAGYRSMATTGNILALGNLGATGAPCTNKTTYAIDGVIGEMVATYKGTDPKGPASKLTIMARGNIFIQNHLLVDGVFTQYKIEAGQTATAGGQVNAATAVGAARNALSKIKLEHSRDVLGLVSDKQIVVGAAAPRPADPPIAASKKREAGVVVMASIAGLGDPAYQPWDETVRAAYLSSPLSYIGSFTTEGLMQAYNQEEEYYINYNAGGAKVTGGSGSAPTANQLYSDAPAPVERTYPGNPLYQAEGYNTLLSLAGNPNIQGTRGRMIVFGSITQKKRGIVGQGNQSYDKDFVYDKRLLTIAPPIFPSSVNVLVRTQAPFSPDDSDPQRRLTYAKSGVIKQTGELDFLGATPAGATPVP